MSNKLDDQNAYSSAGRLLKRKKTEDSEIETSHVQQNIKKGLRPRTKASNLLTNKQTTTKFKSRKHILKKFPQKIPLPSPPIHCVNQVYNNQQLIKIGDIVSLVDFEGGTYFAQIRGLLQDNVGDTCCVLTWLAPKAEFVDDSFTFDPTKFKFALEEDTLRFIECIQFVCRCPSEYFKPIASPYHIYSGALDYKTGTIKEFIANMND